jgi:glycosyltransferase involved in cell wall biosynthesis
MRICLVSQEYPPETARGGIGTQTWNKAHTLARLGHTVHVLSCSKSSGLDLRTEIQSGVTVHRMRPPGEETGTDFPVYTSVTYAVGYTWNILRHLYQLMRANEFEVIDFAEYGAEGFAYQLDRTPWNWAPVVVQLHAPLAMLAECLHWPPKDGDLYRVGTFMEGISIERADALMACSANIADFTADFYGVPRESIDVVHCGVDAEAFRPGDEKDRAGDRPTVLFVGNIANNKGVKTVVAAVLRLRSKYPNIRLQILGTGDDGLREDLQRWVYRSGAEANIEFHGFVERSGLPDFYRRANVFCSPALYEGGVANVYLEAMACGCPVVASIAGAAPDAVTDGETGLLVPPEDEGAVVAALDQILGNEVLARQMGEAARRRVQDYFAMDKYIVRVLKNYQRAIECSRKKLDVLKAAETAGAACAP